MTDSDLHHFRELLPFWVNGTLDEDQQRFMREFLQHHPELQDEVDFNQALRHAVKAVSNRCSTDAGLQRLLQASRTDRGHRSIGWQRKLKSICHDWGLTPAFAVMTLIVAVQSMLLWGPYRIDDTKTPLTSYRSMPETTGTADIKITTDPGTDFGELVILLRQNGARIVNGPSESGELWLSLEERDQLDHVVQQLLGATGIMDVIVIERSER